MRRSPAGRGASETGIPPRGRCHECRHPAHLCLTRGVRREACIGSQASFSVGNGASLSLERESDRHT